MTARAVVACALLALAASAALCCVTAQTITEGCGTAYTTVAKGWFTMDGECYRMYRQNAEGSGSKCSDKCAFGNKGCSSVPGGTEAQCTALIDAYLASSANEAGITSPTPGSGGGINYLCQLLFQGGSWERRDTSGGMPTNSQSCSASFGDDNVMPCLCSDRGPETITEVTGEQASTSSATVTGTTDSVGDVFCVVGAAGSSYAAADVRADGAAYKTTLASPGSFTVTVPGVTDDGSKTAACVGEEATTAVVSSAFDFDTTLPALFNVAAKLTGSTATATGDFSKDGTVYCVVDTTGATVAAATIKSDGVSQTLGAAGSFSIDVSAATSTDKSMFCVGEDAGAKFSEVVEAVLKRQPTDILLSSASVAENSVQGTEVGTLSTPDAGSGEVFNYAVRSQSSTLALQIAGDKLQVGTAGINFEATPSLTVDVRVTESGGLTFDKQLTITVMDINDAPTAVALSSSSVMESLAQATEVGTLSTTDEDAGDTFTYTIESQSVTDAFQISGDKLQVGPRVINFQASPSITVDVRSTDSSGLSYLQQLTITVIDVNGPPTNIALANLGWDAKVRNVEPQGFKIDQLITTDPDDGDTFTYSLHEQSTQDVLQISGDELQCGAGWVHTLSDAQTAILRTTDASGFSYERLIHVSVMPADYSYTSMAAGFRVCDTVVAGVSVAVCCLAAMR